MRIERLGLAAYGPFSDFELDFAGRGRVELVFGSNEAGKSTALRAVRGLLFGIPEHTGDAHRHPASELAIEALLSDDGGEALFVRRRRKRKESLRAKDDSPLAEEVLGRLLGGIDAAAYERLFAFDHERLAASAEEMLKGKGDVGEALFAAGAGNSAVGAVLRELEQEASDLFTPLARTRPLNTAIKDYRTLQAELRKTRLLPDAYHAQRESLTRAQQEAERIRAERLRLEAELAKLSRVERALPWLARRRVARAELSGQALPSVPVRDVSERRVRAERERDNARSELRHVLVELGRDRERLERIGPVPALVEVAEATLLELLASSSSVGSARRELPERRAALSLLSGEVVELSRKLELAAHPGELSIQAESVARLRRLLAEYAVLVAEEQQLVRRKDEARRRIEQLEPGAEDGDFSLPALSSLEHALAEGRAARDLAQRRAVNAELVQRLERDANRARARLVPAPPAELPVVDWVVPSDETLERLAAELAVVGAKLSRLGERQERATERARRVSEDVQRMELTFALPSEHDLVEARASRDALLAAVKRGDGEVVDELSSAINRADEIVDRLRREATRVSELAALRAELLSLEEEQRRVAHERLEQESLRETLWREHRGGFESLRFEPLPPQEMRAWLGRYREALRVALEAEAARERSRDIEVEGERLRALLASALGGAQTTDPALLLREAERRAEQARARHEARLEAERMLASARSELAAVEAEVHAHTHAVEQFREQFARARAGLGRQRDASPEELREMLDGFTALAERLQQVARTRQEIEALERRAADFDARVGELTLRYAPELGALPAESALPKLASRQREALALSREQHSLAEKLAELEQQKVDADARLAEADATLRDLAASLGLASPDELPLWEARSQRVSDLSGQLAEAERELLVLGDGRSLDELAQEAEPHAADEIPPRKREIVEELEQLEQAAYQARREVESIEAGLLLLGGERGADVAQRLSEVAATIRAQARYYAELRVAHGILSRELQRYREKNQGPILERASDLFARFTLGSFRGLRVGLEAQVLECVLSTGQGLAVAELSEGVRYQLYFALRLASLERYLERGQALPLVLDDVFIHWDDERALAGFQVLGELSRRTQVLFFTHHAHLAEVGVRGLGQSLRQHALPVPVRAA